MWPRNQGEGQNLYVLHRLHVWGSVFGTSYIISFLAIVVISPRVGRFLRNDHQSRPRLLFDFRCMWPRNRTKINNLNCYTSLSIEPLNFKLHWMTLDWRLHNCTIQDFSISCHGTQKRGWRWKMRFVLSDAFSSKLLKRILYENKSEMTVSPTRFLFVLRVLLIFVVENLVELANIWKNSQKRHFVRKAIWTIVRYPDFFPYFAVG